MTGTFRSGFSALLACAIIGGGIAVAEKVDANPIYDFGTKNETALFHFQKGWEQILDLGLWSNSESSFRKAAKLDPNFVIGKALVARISLDAEERTRLLAELLEEKDNVDEEGRLLLESYLLTIQAMNFRATGQKPPAGFNKDRLALTLSNFTNFVKAHPEEQYITAEYIEIIHAVKGAKEAIKAMEYGELNGQMTAPFFTRYRSSLEAELGNFPVAKSYALKFKKMLNNPRYPEQYVLTAEINFHQGLLSEAKCSVEKAIAIDPNHLIAVGLLARINTKMDSDESLGDVACTE